jgi:hypothetical protein
VVAATIVACARRPRREAFAGLGGGAIARLHALLPGPAERGLALLITAAGFSSHRDQAPTAGNLFAPRPEHAGISGGWKPRRGYWRPTLDLLLHRGGAMLARLGR